MTERVLSFKIEKKSAIGALHLLRNAPGVSSSSPLAPVVLYLEQLAESGRRTQRSNLERAAKILGGSGLDYEWRDLRSGHLEFLRGALKGMGYSPSVINSTISAVRAVARWAWHLGQMELGDYERLRDVGLVKKGERRRPARALSSRELAILFKCCEREPGVLALRDAALISLLYGGGLRRDEACSLDVASYSKRTHAITVHGKGGKYRTVYFENAGARRAIHAWLRSRGPESGALLNPVNRHGQVIVKRLSASGLYMALQRRAELAGLEHFTPHDLRRSLATHLRDNHTDLDLVRQLLGHVEIRTTQVYLMTSEKEKREASMKIRVPFRTRRGGKRRRRRRRRS